MKTGPGKQDVTIQKVEFVTPHILIVDDEAPARLRLRQLLSDIAGDFPHRIVGEAEDASAALNLLADEGADGLPQPKLTDLVLLDVQMPGMNGIELARHLGALPEPPAIVFVTAFDEYAVKAFEVHALDYLLKPVRAQRLLDSMRRATFRLDKPSTLEPASTAPLSGKSRQRSAIEAVARESLPGGRAHIAVHERGRLLLVPACDIVYLKAEQKYVTVRTGKREYLIEEPLTALEQEFSSLFVRVHRNALVARKAIMGFERVIESGGGPARNPEGEPRWEVTLDGIPERLPVSRRLWPALKSLAKAPK